MRHDWLWQLSLGMVALLLAPPLSTRAEDGKKTYDLKPVTHERLLKGTGEKGNETWPGDTWKSGGGPAWITGSYDAEQNLIFWATGNPGPDWNGDVRQGDNLYTDSLLALDPETGEIRWHFQFTPHDVWDYDGNTDLFLVNVQRSGHTLKALAQPNRNGYLYVLDRTTGKYLHGVQYVDKLNWSKGLDENGRPIVNPQFLLSEEAMSIFARARSAARMAPTLPLTAPSPNSCT